MYNAWDFATFNRAKKYWIMNRRSQKFAEIIGIEVVPGANVILKFSGNGYEILIKFFGDRAWGVNDIAIIIMQFCNTALFTFLFRRLLIT